MDDASAGSAVAVALLVSLPVLVASLAGADMRVGGALTASGPVELDGSTGASSESGIIHAQGDSVEASLQADRMEAEIEWERGYVVGTDERPRAYRHVDGSGVDWYNFTSAAVEFPPFTRIPQILSLPDNGTASVASEAPGSTFARTVENHSLVRHGSMKEQGTHNVSIDFFYTLEDPHVSFTGADEGKVSGNFTFFVNNVTIDVTDSDQGTWSNWTGYNESNPDSPAAPLENPAAKEYEYRATTLRVTNGTLWINVTDRVEFYSKETNTSVNGSITAPSVSGKLLSEPLLYEYDDDPLRLFGNGSLAMGLAGDDASGKSMQAPGATTTTPPLALAPSGGFDVQRTQGVEVSQVETTSAWNPVSWFDAGTWLVLAVLGAAVVGAGVGAVVPERVHGVIGAAFGGWREHQYKRWARDAELAIENGDFDEAETLASRATRLQPEAPDAWMSLAMARFGGDAPERALPTFREARRTLGTLPVLMFKLWVTYADDLDEPEAIVEAWLTMASSHPEYAVVMYAEEDFDALQDKRVQAKLAELEDRLLDERPELAAMLRGQRPSDTSEDGDAGHGPEVA